MASTIHIKHRHLHVTRNEISEIFWPPNDSVEVGRLYDDLDGARAQVIIGSHGGTVRPCCPNHESVTGGRAWAKHATVGEEVSALAHWPNDIHHSPLLLGNMQ